MRIGVMLRHVGQHGGGVLGYTQQLMRQLPAVDPGTEYFFLLADESHRGSLGRHENVREVVIGPKNKLLWDQVAVARAQRQHGFDIVFNPKYSLPFNVRCKTVFVCHGLDWYVMPWGSKLVDRLSHRYLIPRYAAKADGIIAVSDTPQRHLIQYLHVPPDKIRRIYLGVNPAFAEPVSDETRASVRQRFGLPERFFLYVGQIYPPKNFGRLLRAYARVGPAAGVHLVVAGEHRWLCGDDLALIDSLKIRDWVCQPGWVGHDDLPAFYRLSEALLLPSLYEACPSPLLEAMSAGCPFVTANRHGTAELAGDAGLLVDPEDVDSIASGMRRIATDVPFRERCVQAGYRRVAEFSWRKCASETREFLHEVASSP